MRTISVENGSQTQYNGGEVRTMRILRAGLIVFLALLCIPRTVHAQGESSIAFYYGMYEQKGEKITMQAGQKE